MRGKLLFVYPLGYFNPLTIPIPLDTSDIHQTTSAVQEDNRDNRMGNSPKNNNTVVIEERIKRIIIASYFPLFQRVMRNLDAVVECSHLQKTRP